MTVSETFIWFFLYSAAGWIYETAFCSVKEGKWDNRGMLIGPYCPIYGFGAVLDILVCKNLPNPYAVFFVCMAGSAVMEYSTSYFTEKVFHAVWWDYGDKPLNLHGRVCLPYSVCFGFAGILILFAIHPCVTRATAYISHQAMEALAIAFAMLISADCVLTADSLASFNVKLSEMKAEIDANISRRCDAALFGIKEGRERLLPDIKKKIATEEWRKAIPKVTWPQFQAVKSVVSFRKPELSGINVKEMIRKGRERKRGEE